MRRRGWILALALLAAGCGGDADTTEQTAPTSNEVDAPAEATTDEAAEVSTTTQMQSEEETTTSEVPAPAFSAEEAIGRYDDWIDRLEDYTESGLVDGDSTYGQALAIVEGLDPSLLEGNAEDVAIDFHNCSSGSVIAAREFYEISGVEIEVEHLEQHAIDDRTWALDLRSFVRLEGIPEQVEKSTVLVTVDGVGPTIDLEPGDCDLPRSAIANDLVNNAATTLGIELDSTAPATSTSSVGDNPSCEDVLSATPGSFGEGGCLWASSNTLALMGQVECGWVFDLEGDEPGTWFGVDGGEWQQLPAEEYTQDFIVTACQ